MAKVGIVGGGGREHALGWSIAQHPGVEVIYFKGNPGIALDNEVRTINIDGAKKENFGPLADAVDREGIEALIFGPELPLDDGGVDFFIKRGYPNAFGPLSSGAKIESDKFFSYSIMKEAGIPQAESTLCFNTADAEQAINRMATDNSVVIKARGLTGGKGVYVCDSMDEALEMLKVHAKEFGPEVLIAERLFGQEFSVFGISDGERVVPFEISIQDHKRLLDGDKGPNTGGMGAHGPVPIADKDMVKFIADKMMTPAVQQIKKENGEPYKGFLYAAVIMTEHGPKILEYNCRFGDPEAQPAVMMLRDGLYLPIKYALEGRLDQMKVEFRPGAACCVVMAANGYPDSKIAGYVKGLPIGGLDKVAELQGVKVFHAGTGSDEQGNLTVAGGRVLGVTAYSLNGIESAQPLAYTAVHIIDEATRELNNRIVFICRHDIAGRALEASRGSK